MTTNEAINPDPPIDSVRAEAYTLPAGFKWDSLNLNDPLELKESLDCQQSFRFRLD